MAIRNTTLSYSERVSRLSEKLNGLQANIEQEKLNRVETLDSKIARIDENVHEWHEVNNKRFNTVKEQLTTALKYIDEEKAAKETQLDSRLQELRSAETRIFERFD